MTKKKPIHKFNRAAKVAGAMILILLVGPWMIPVPPLENTSPPGQFADEDSRFVKVNSIQVHYKIWGNGLPVFILLHGFGASLFSWREVAEPLTQYGTVIAYDRPAFGLTERPMTWEKDNPYGPQAQVEMVRGLMDVLQIEKAILVGNSAGGTISAQIALQYPERVQALILVDAAIYQGGGAPSWILPLLTTPQMDHLGPLVARQLRKQAEGFLQTAWHDPSKISEEVYEGYKQPFQVHDWDRALWELSIASRESNVSDHLNEITMPVLVITGDDDRIVPTEQSRLLAEELPNAFLKVISNSGHLPHEETPAEFVQAVGSFLTELP